MPFTIQLNTNPQSARECTYTTYLCRYLGYIGSGVKADTRQQLRGIEQIFLTRANMFFDFGDR